MDDLQNGPLRQCCIGTMLRFDMRIWTIVLRVTATVLACMMSAAKPQEATAARAAMPDDMAQRRVSASARNQQRMWSMELAELRRDRELRSQKPRKSPYPRRYTYAIVNANPAFQRTTNRAVGCGLARIVCCCCLARAGLRTSKLLLALRGSKLGQRAG